MRERRAGAGLQEMFQNCLRALVAENDAALPNLLYRQRGALEQAPNVFRVPGEIEDLQRLLGRP
ncbi:MAG: hypothetical protein ACE15E_03655 [Acidobacteriota bacterium]